ncbi:MAG TPA: EAL domain-containing protein [Capillimicrobium sp.]|jgi:diguanylate cyclase (GGDEF)-like protein/PAS domain S-box-containing protein
MALSLLTRGDGGGLVRWAPVAVYAAVALALAWRAAQPGRDRLAWALLAIGVTAYAAGDALWAASDQPADDVPLPVNVLWLTFYLLAYAAFGALLAGRVRPFRVAFWLDGLIGACTLAAVSGAALSPAFPEASRFSTGEIVAALAFPAADALLVAMALWAWLVTGRRGSVTWALIAAGFALLGAGDVSVALHAAAGSYEEGTVAALAFPAAVIVVACAAFARPGSVRVVRLDSVLSLIAPICWVLTCLGLLFAEDLIDLPEPAHALALTGLSIAVVRAVITLLEAGSLHETRRVERGFQDAAIGMAIVTPDLRCLRANASLGTLLGRSAATLDGVTLAKLAHPDDRARLRGLGERTESVEVRLVRADGEPVDVVLSVAQVRDEDSEPYLFCQVEDVTQRRRAERLTAAAADLGRRAIQEQDVRALMDRIVVITTETLGTALSFVAHAVEPGATLMLAASESSIAGRTYPLRRRSMIEALLREGRSLYSNDLEADERFDRHQEVAERGLARALGAPIPRQRDGSYVVVVHRTADQPPFTAEDASFLESVANILATALDRAETEATTRHQALHDPLTGLANRTFLHGQVERALAGAARGRDSVALLLLDVDRFKLVNDTIGHSAGDTVLCEVADRLRGLVRGGDIAARLGGDEFVIACSGVADERDVAGLAARIVDAFRAPFRAGGRDWQLAASVGVALGGEGSTADELLRDADLAMYRAKDRGGARYEIFDGAMRARVVQRLGLEAALHAAVDRDELVLHFQPLVDLVTGELEGFEALLRWEHPERGLVGPDEFIAIAEDTDLILPIGHWVLRSACSQIAAWNAAWPERPPVHVRVNLSPRQITPALAAAVATAIRQTGIRASQLGLEITERLLVEEPTASTILEEVRDLGVSVALDDFGTGYSSLSYLQHYPVDVLKLDRSLIAELGRTPQATAIVKAAVDMATALGLRAVGEGIEDAAQARELRRLGCPLGQGFLFSRPLPLEEAEALLASPRSFFAPV